MNNYTEEKIIEEIIEKPGDFYLKQVCKFLQQKKIGNAFLSLRGNQIKALEANFTKPTINNKSPRDNLAEFIAHQCKKEEKGERSPKWLILGFADENINGPLCQFLFEFDEDFLEDLRDKVVHFLNQFSYEDTLMCYTYFDCSPEVEGEIRDWRQNKLFPTLSKKLFYTLLDVHREKKSEKKSNFKDKKEELCQPLTD